jgi:hypothetical protein
MCGAIGNFVAITVVVMRSCQQLARFDKHFANMLVTMVCGSYAWQVMKIEDIHNYLSKINELVDEYS